MKYLLLLFLLFTSLLHSQDDNEYKYFYIKIDNDSSYVKLTLNNINEIQNSKYKDIECLGNNIFKVSNNIQSDYLILDLPTRKFKLPYRDFENQRFCKIEIFLNPVYNGENIRIINGDRHKIYKNCISDDCDQLVITFSQIIYYDGKIIIKGDQIFDKYIFDK